MTYTTSPPRTTFDRITFARKTGFHKELKKRVDEYFVTAKIPKTANHSQYDKAIAIFISLWITYSLILTLDPGLVGLLVLYPLLGILFALVGFNIMHDGAHGSFSKQKWINTLAGYSLNMVGANVYFWKQKHNIAHHTYTNIQGHEEDFEIPFMRAHEAQERKPIHKYQHVYWVFLYSMTYLLWITVSDFRKYFSGKRVRAQFEKKMHYPLREHIIFWMTKILFVIVFVYIPVYIHGSTYALTGFLLMSLVCGLMISTVFQLAHIVETTSYVAEPTDLIVHDEWAAHQIKTTSDFATKNKIITWLCGGLNYQVEHHLFSGISHSHYPALMPIVKEVAQEFGIVHNEQPSLWSAIVSHIRMLKKFGNED